MKKFAVLGLAIALSACGSPVLRSEDLSKHLETQGYSKVLIRDSFSCGKMGKGRHFIATKAGKIVNGQICYLKKGSDISYKVDELK